MPHDRNPHPFNLHPQYIADARNPGDILETEVLGIEVCNGYSIVGHPGKGAVSMMGIRHVSVLVTGGCEQEESYRITYQLVGLDTIG